MNSSSGASALGVDRAAGVPGLRRRATIRLGAMGPWPAVLAVALAARLAVAPFHGFFADLQTYVDWGDILRHHPRDPYSAGAAAYAAGHLAFPPNYPPLTLDIFGALDEVRLWFGSPRGPEAAALAIHSSGASAALMKLPAILADLACAIAIHRLGLRITTRRRALVAASAWALSPVAIVDGALWGQTDGVGAALVVAGLVLAIRGRAAAAGIAGAAAIMLKPQPVVFAPLLAVYLARRWGPGAPARAAAGAAGTVALVWLPMAAGHAGEIAALGRNVSTVVDAYPYASFNAFNLWWLLGVADRSPSAPYLLGLSIDAAGTAIVVIVLAAVCVGLIRRPSGAALLLGAALVAAAFFTAGPLQHERYLVPCVPLLAAAILYDRGHLGALLLATATSLLNMLLVALPSLAAAERPGAAGWWFEPHTSVARVVALANIALVAILAVRFRDLCRGGGSPVPRPDAEAAR